ncbi:rod shape-determining protein RodA [Candidatus Nomurabacteria bacterium]|nr:rod shape-determining protein RodA [Candidatus Nomurabacteria bacterium]MCB9820350.1 rod shape-determining protein RodA [Candidatus Nomurabacteria bacterium]
MSKFAKKLDFFVIVPAVLISTMGLVTMASFSGDSNFFGKQVLFICISLLAMYGAMKIDLRLFKRQNHIVYVYLITLTLLLGLFVFGKAINGAKSWYDFGFFSFQPSDLMKLVLIIILAKYFSRRHTQIAYFRHILISGVYAIIPFILIFLQPDFGSALVIFLIWFGMILISGISKKHLIIVGSIMLVTSLFTYFFIFEDYQRDRIATFINPLSDIQGAGYNAYQSTIAVGSGQLLGKGIGYGTQSRLKYLPEYQTDFIFAAFAEEWGFVGEVLLILLYTVLISRILNYAILSSSNFERLFALGVAVYFMGHIIVNIGMNIGLMPVTGIPLPFMSYGGSHLLIEYICIGFLVGTLAYRRGAHKEDYEKEFVGI